MQPNLTMGTYITGTIKRQLHKQSVPDVGDDTLPPWREKCLKKRAIFLNLTFLCLYPLKNFSNSCTIVRAFRFVGFLILRTC